MKRKIIRTNSREIYEKFNTLNFSNEVLLRNVAVDNRQLNKILSNINSSKKILDIVKVGEFIVIRKVSPIDFSIYLK